MTKSNLPKSVRAHIRKEKAILRKNLQSKEEQRKAFDELYKKLQIPRDI